MELTKQDLLGTVTAEELDALTTEAGGEAEVDELIVESVSMVEAYAAQYVVGDEWIRRLVRPLVVERLYQVARAGQVPDKRRHMADEARRELRDLRDGRFDGVLARKAPAPDGLPARQGRSGSREARTFHFSE